MKRKHSSLSFADAAAHSKRFYLNFPMKFDNHNAVLMQLDVTAPALTLRRIKKLCPL